MRQGLTMTMVRFGIVWKFCAVVLYLLLDAAIIFYWWSSNPPRTGGIVSFQIYEATIFLFIAMILFKIMLVSVMFLGSDPAPLLILLFVHTGIAITIAILTGISLFKYNSKPAGLTFAWTVFLVYAIYSVCIGAHICRFFFSMNDILTMNNAHIRRTAKTLYAKEEELEVNPDESHESDGSSSADGKKGH
jgi:hypothetical protein